MAKVIIEIEDLPDGKVKVVATPNFESMALMIQSGTEASPAQGMALFAINRIREESKRSAPTPIWLPKIGRA